MNSILEKLLQLRHQKVNKLTAQLSQQKRLCLRYEKNINALTVLSNKSPTIHTTSAALLSNKSSYKKNIQRVINWQKQEQQLADIQAQNLQISLKQQVCQEKMVEIVLEQQQHAFILAQARKEQKISDGISTQCWLRNHV